MAKNRPSKKPARSPAETRPEPLLVPGVNSDALRRGVMTAAQQLQAARDRLTAMIDALNVLGGPGALDAIATPSEGPVAAGTRTLTAELPSLLSELNRLTEQIEECRGAERRSRRGRFEEAAAAHGWVMTGSWPEPVIQQVVFIVVDETKESATVNGRALGGPPTAERLVAAVADELGALERDGTEPGRFATELWNAYAAAGGEPDRGLVVFDLIRSLLWVRQSKRFQRDPRAETFRQYPLAQFRTDLTRYLAAGAAPVTHGGAAYRVEITAGSFAQDGLFMYFPQTERLGTCGRITFRLVEVGDTT
jgi:hypothetical protein